ncbi:hypothetical protein CJ030_MR4G003031 [Morella rubra]|uniref:Uncharacterized protein n=1 Tax=Morella rubra TaxID=262757 RepID=A0A6A1VS86_9ROSI|nr:hypothetical protein CJ030_MR4G003031 [Morella rubra]
MITVESKLYDTNGRSLPPPTCCININILKSITVTTRRMLAGFGQKHSEKGGIAAQLPPAESATPTGCNSDNTPRGNNSDTTLVGYNSDAIRNY